MVIIKHMESLALNPNIFLNQHISFLDESGLTFLAFEILLQTNAEIKEGGRKFSLFHCGFRKRKTKKRMTRVIYFSILS